MLNDPAYAGGAILFAGPDFGTGSSREHAVWALRDYGFTRRAQPPVRRHLPRQLAASRACSPASITEEQVETVLGRDRGRSGDHGYRRPDGRDRRRSGTSVPFEIDDYTRWRLLEGLDDIGLTLRDEARITDFEARPRSWRPTTLPVEGTVEQSHHRGARRAGAQRRTDLRPDHHQGRQAAARARSRSAGPRTSSPRRWSPRCSARAPSVLRDVPDISDVARRPRPARDPRRHGEAGRRVRRAAARRRATSSGAHARRSTRTPAPAASRSCSAGRCCTGSARRSSPTSAAAASATGPIDFHLDALRNVRRRRRQSCRPASA